MKAMRSVTRQFFAQLISDTMLAALLVVPIIMGIIFRFGVPALEKTLCAHFQRSALLLPYYYLFDLLLSIMTPVMATAAGAMVILDEADCGCARALSVTPIGRLGYLYSRIGVPSVLATIYCAGITLIFRLSELSTFRLLLLALCSGALGVVTALMIASLSQNKVEGLAYSKLSGLFVLGLPACLLLPEPWKYLFCPLPSYWMCALAMGGSLWNFVGALLSAAALTLLLTRFFLRRVLA